MTAGKQPEGIPSVYDRVKDLNHQLGLSDSEQSEAEENVADGDELTDLRRQLHLFKQAFKESEQARLLAESAAHAMEKKLDDVKKLSKSTVASLESKYQAKIKALQETISFETGPFQSNTMLQTEEERNLVLNDLQTRLSQKTQELSDLQLKSKQDLQCQATFQELQQSNQCLRTELKRLRSQLQSPSPAPAERDRQLDDLRARIMQYETAAKQLEDADRQHRLQVEELDAGLVSNERTIGELNQAGEQQKKQIAGLETQIEERDCTIRQLRRDLELLLKQCNESEGAVVERSRTIESLRHDNDALRRQIDTLTSDVDARDETIRDLNDRISTSHRQLEQAKGECQDCSRWQATIRDLRDDRCRAEGRQQQHLTHLQHTVRSLRDDLRLTGAEVRVLQQDLYPLLRLSRERSARFQSAYADVNEQRRLLANLVEEIRGNIRVYCRLRPCHPDEDNAIVKFGDDQTPESVTIRKQGSAPLRFRFDKVFRSDSTQTDVFNDVRGLIDLVADGFHVCIFAYGQTGSGKTYTMVGSETNPGVQRLAIDRLFHLKSDSDTIRCSLLEIYNESLLDLLTSNSDESQLKIGLGSNGNTEVQGLSQIAVQTQAEAHQLFVQGSKRRSIASTKMNSDSSRSHLILSITFTKVDRIANRTQAGILHLIDLAGSESVSRSGATGDRLKEAQAINKSLSALGDVIAAKATKNAHIPFRNSKLTYLLQSSLSRNSKTLMIVNCSPATADLTETITSLKFATRVRSVELNT